MNRNLQQEKLNQALCPQSIQLDGRSVVDRLSFAARYSELILYYDKNNDHKGNWRQFLLKDPVILQAMISKTNYQVIYQLFSKLVNVVHNEVSATVLNEICKLICGVFVDINDWLEQMENDHKDYLLKTFVQAQVEGPLAVQLWLFIALQKKLAISNPKVEEPNYRLFNDFYPLWHKQIVKINHSDKADVTQLIDIFKSIFSFYVQVINKSKEEYYSLKDDINNYPDTALLIAFIRLLEVHQKQLNKLSRKHLDFYYKDILKQSINSSSADEVYLCLALSENNSTFTLPERTLFDAGVDNNGQPIVFTSGAEQELNQAKITQINNLTYRKSVALEPVAVSGEKSLSESALYLNQQAGVDQIKLDQQGKMLTWPLFGQVSEHEVRQGFVFASPLLFLQGGVRVITVSFTFQTFDTFEQPQSISLFEQAQIYLTVTDAWLDISDKCKIVPENQPTEENSRYKITVQITLTEADPAIIPWSENSESIKTPQPIFKVLFYDSVDLKNPPQLLNVSINTDVTFNQGFELANNNGLLPNDLSFLPFGPVVKCFDSFYLANNEVFAKPLTSLELSLNWLNLPASFADYYKEYNEHLPEVKFDDDSFSVAFSIEANNQWYDLKVKYSETQGKSSNTGYVDSISLFQSSTSGEISDCNLEKTLEEQQQELLKTDINTWWSKIKFFIFNLREWLEDRAKKKARKKEEKDDNPTEISTGLEYISKFDLSFFEKDEKDGEKPQTNSFLTNGDITPSEQLRLRIQLQKPNDGFGNDLYSKVVNLVGQKNSQIILKLAKNPEKNINLHSMPNLAFTPEIGGLEVHYTAQTDIDFTELLCLSKVNNNYPFELFYLDSFACYPVYNAQGSILLQRSFKELTKKDNVCADPNGIKLFAGIEFDSVMYIALEQITAPCQLSVFFELAESLTVQEPSASQEPSAGQEFSIEQEPSTESLYPDKKQTDTPSLYYFCLTDAGWQPLTVLSDETNNFNCSGIIEFDIPVNINNQSVLMAGNEYWLAIGVNGQINTEAIYVNTQVIKVHRAKNEAEQSDIELPLIDTLTNPVINPSIKPGMASESISAPVSPISQIDSILQPFPSFNGIANENEKQFYKRVSHRIGDKDRSSSGHNYINMALQADDKLFYCKVLKDKAGVVSLGLVNGYNHVSHPNAFEPSVNTCRMLAIQQFIEKRSSPFAQIQVKNLRPFSIKVSAVINCAISRRNTICQQLEQALTLFLSPWIESNQQQLEIDKGLTSSEIMDFIISQPGVDEVISVTLLDNCDNEFLLSILDDQLIVSAPIHDIQAKAIESDLVSTLSKEETL